MSEVKHGRANHDPISMSPECLCGAKGVKDTMWDRYYCPVSNDWLEGIFTACWCPECLAKPKTEYEDIDLNTHGEIKY